MFLAARKVITNNRIDYIVTFNPAPWGTIAWLIAKIYKRPIITGFIGNDFALFNRKGIYGTIVRKVAMTSDIVTVTGSSMTASFTEKGFEKSRIFIYPHCVPDDWFEEFPALKKEFTLITVCSLIKRKKVEDQLYAVAELAGKNLAVNLCIVGSGPEEVFLRKTARELAISDQVHFTGYQKNVREYLNRADIYLQTSRSEGLSLSLIEAMTAGLVPVVTRAGSEADIISDGVNGFLIDVNDHKSLAEKIEYLLNRENFVRMQKEVLKRLPEFRIERAISVCNDIIGSLIVKGRIDTLTGNSKSRWYINRLKTMSVAEGFFRIGQLIRRKSDLHLRMGKKSNKHFISLPEKILQPSVRRSDLNPSTVIDIFSQPFDFSIPIDWHKDPSSGETFPKIFSRWVDTRLHPKRSAKHVWEINRMQYLTRLAINYQITQDKQYVEEFVKIIRLWIGENPFMTGVNWYSNIELSIRLITWFLCWEIMDLNRVISQIPELEKFVDREWAPVIYQHCRHIYRYPSRYSSANNHLISEYCGLYIAGSYWKFRESVRWKNYGKAGLEKEIILQHNTEGINREESSEYIQFITDFFLLPLIIGNNTKEPFSEGYHEMFRKIIFYIRELTDNNGNILGYGDSDDGMAFMLGNSDPHKNYYSILHAGAILFNDPDLIPSIPDAGCKNRVLLGSKAENISGPRSLRQIRPSAFYPGEGHYFMRSNSKTEHLSVHFDAAPLGYLSIAAHGHSDALSFTLSWNEQPVFIDPGTYCYHTLKEWRNYFRGTIAHNTIRINGTDQAEIGGPTLWNNHYRVTVRQQETDPVKDLVVASHDGYKRFGVVHTRKMLLTKNEGSLLIEDSLQHAGNEFYDGELVFHLHPAIKVMQVKENEFRLTHDETRLILKLDDNLKGEIFSGIQEPVLGWFSPSFYVKQECPVIISRFRQNGDMAFHTKIFPE